MALVAVRGFHRSLGTGKSLSFVMRLNIASPLRIFGSAALGVAYGYFLWTQPLAPPEPWHEYLLDLALALVKATESHFSIRLSYDLTFAFLSSFPAIPNTLILAVLAVPTIRIVRHERLFIYSVLIWPIFLHIFHWVYRWYIEGVAASVGADPRLLAFDESYYYPSKAALIAFIYSLFLFVVVFLSRICFRNTHNRVRAGF